MEVYSVLTMFFTRPHAAVAMDHATVSGPFGTALARASRAASREALPNVCFRTGFTREAGSEAVGGLHRQGEAMKSWLHAVYTSI